MGDAVWDDRAPGPRKPPAGSDGGGSGIPNPETSEPGTGQTPPLPPSSVPIRVTDDRDGAIENRVYSYWPNAWVRPDGVIVAFVGERFFLIQPATGEVDRLGVPRALQPYPATGEGRYWDAEGRIYLLDGPRLRRVEPFAGEDVVVFDITNHPGCDLWQAHSSDDGATHSATVRQIVADGPYPKIGTVVYRGHSQRFYAAEGTLDESQVDASGRFVIIKETFLRGGRERLDNRFLDLETGASDWLWDEEGAVGHSDCGPGFVVGEDDQIGACVRLSLLDRSERRALFSTWNMGAVSVRRGRCLLSDATALSLVALDGSGVTPLLSHGMTGGGYDYQVHANLSPCGRVAAWVSNVAGRMDLYLFVLPDR